MILESLGLYGGQKLENPNYDILDALRDLDDTSSVPRRDATPPGPQGLANALVASACIHILAETVAHLPFQIFERKGTTRLPRPDLRTRMLLNGRANPEMDAMTFRETLTGHCLGWGAGYAEVEYTKGGEPLHLWPIPPWRCRAERLDGKLVYIVSTSSGLKALEPSRIFQVMWWSPNGYRPYSPLRLAAMDLRLSEKLEMYALKYFNEGYHVSGFVTSPKALDAPAIKKLRSQLEDLHKGLENSHRIGLLDEGMDFVNVRLPLEEAQLLQTRTFEWQQIASLFRITPDRVNILAKASYASLDATEIRFVKDAIAPLCRRWEAPVDDRLLDRWGDSSGSELYSRINLRAVLRGDPKVAAEVSAIERGWGIISADEWRAIDERDPLGGTAGNATLWPLNYAPGGEGFQPKAKESPLKALANLPHFTAMGLDVVGVALRETLSQATERILGRERRHAGDLAAWYSNPATRRFTDSEFTAAYSVPAILTGKKDAIRALALHTAMQWRNERPNTEPEIFIDHQVKIFLQLWE